MAGTAEVPRADGEPADTDPPAGGRAGPGRRAAHRGPRWAGAVVLLVIVALLAPATIIARYARNNLLDTDHFVATVAPIAADPAVRDAITNRVTDTIIDNVDITALIRAATSALNLSRADALAPLVGGPLTDWLRGFIYKHVSRFVNSSTFQTLWSAVLRASHGAVNRLLTGEQSGAVRTSGDSVVLDIGPIVDAAKNALVDDGFTLVAKVPSVNTSFTLVESEQITKVQSLVRWLDRAATWLPWAAVLVFGLAVWLAPARRRAAMIGVFLPAVLMLVLLIGNGWARRRYLDDLTARRLDAGAGLVIYNQILHDLVSAATTLLVALLITLAWLWLIGPGRAGTALRRRLEPGSRWVAGQAGWVRGRGWVALDRYRAWLFLLLGLAALVLLLSYPWLSTVGWLTLAALIVTAGFAIARRLPRPPGAASPRSG